MIANNKKTIQIYTDGACSKNPGKGGIGIILIYKENKKEISFAYENTTNNRMELLALIIALESLKEKGLFVEAFSDSQYVVNAIKKKWLEKWLNNGFNNGKIKNQDLWMRLFELLKQHHVNLNWVKGHHTNPFNNRCDELAVTAIKQKTLLIDQGFIN